MKTALTSVIVGMKRKKTHFFLFLFFLLFLFHSFYAVYSFPFHFIILVSLIRLFRSTIYVSSSLFLYTTFFFFSFWFFVHRFWFMKGRSKKCNNNNKKRTNRIDSYGVGLHLCFSARLTPTFLDC